MDLENDLQKLRLCAAPAGLRGRILRDARVQAAPRRALIPPWFTALERHWLYPGRVPGAALVVVWLIIASLRFTTPASLLPESHSLSRLNPGDIARFELERARLIAELSADEFAPSASPPPHPEIPPRS